MAFKDEIAKPGVRDGILQLVAVPVPVSQIASLYGATERQILSFLAEVEQDSKRQEAVAAANLRAAGQGRPFPASELLERPDFFAPGPELRDWVVRVFLTPGGALYNPEHDHLAAAIPHFQWTTMEYRKGGMVVAGQAERPSCQGNKWLKGRVDQQLVDWFGEVPLFLITIQAGLAAQRDDAGFCALIEHELLHCAQAEDEFGSPRFNKDGDPVLTICGHDVEEFVTIVRRYGVGAGAGKTAEFVAAAGRAPSVAAASIASACGTCR